MDISQVPELVDNTGYPLMIDSYNSVPMVFPRVMRVNTITDDLLYGDKGSVITGMGEPVERDDNQEFKKDQFRSAHTWYMKTHQWGLSFDIPDRMVRASNAVGRITQLVQQQTRSFGRQTAMKKDKWVADFLQQGVLTAGNAKYFDGSFPNETDPNPKFIYDGLPLFDTAHPLAIGSSTYSNHDASLSLDHTNLQTVKRRMRSTNNVDERGQKILLNPDTLVIGPDLEDTAFRLVSSDRLSGSANNDANIHRGRFDVVVWDFLTTSGAWWLCERMSESIEVYDSGEPVIEVEWVPSRKCWSVTMETHFGVTCKNWRQWYAANIAAS